MVAAVGVGEGVQGIIGVHTEFFGRDKDRPGGTQADVAAAGAYRAGTHSGCGVVSGTRADHHTLRQTDRFRHIRPKCSYWLPALEEFWELLFGHTADAAHLFAPAPVLHVQKQHPGGVGIVRGVDAGETVDQIVLGQHDFLDFCEQIRLIFPHPQQLGGGEPGEGDVGGITAQLLPANSLVEVVHFLGRPPVVPEDGRAQNMVRPVQGHQPVHLPARADALDLAGIKARQQFRHP